FGDEPVSVPLRLAGGVLEQAIVDGQPARLQVVEPKTSLGNSPSPSGQTDREANASRSPVVGSRLLLLHLTGKGRKQIELRVRLSLVRQGGWGIVRAQGP